MGVQQVNQSVLLQHRNEDRRGEQTVFRVLPPGQSLHGAHLSGDSADHGLKIYLDMLLLQSVVQIFQNVLGRDRIVGCHSEQFSSEGVETGLGQHSHCSNISTIMIPENLLEVKASKNSFRKDY
jgi:hypothetical protein